MTERKHPMIKIIIPRAGQTVEEATIVRWLKAVGEKVTKGEKLVEIETDKSVMEIEAPESGILHEIITPEGATVTVLSPIALLSEVGD